MIYPSLEVGIMHTPIVVFELHARFKFGTHILAPAIYEARIAADKISLNDMTEPLFLIEPLDEGAFFELKEVTIGIDFHWQRKENQRFEGSLSLLADHGEIVVANRIDIERYLLSVISSEMSATASLELLKAHAVISRSWVMAQIDKNKQLAVAQESFVQTQEEWVRWWDREDHALYHVCADDHCQRYQGITRASTEQVRVAIGQTIGQVLTDADNRVCDARFSKCCGGVTETFENCWELAPHPYLQSFIDADHLSLSLDLRKERDVQQFVHLHPDCFCNCEDSQILSQVLNGYDQETTHFFRWQEEYTQQELAELISQRLEMDFGNIVALIPLERGYSGRIIRLKIVGTLRELIIGKELLIRRSLSRSHLYSSAFIVEAHEITNGIAQRFVLKGAGWGHGVGLCQIGAAVMADRGYDYTEILSHYFRGARLQRLYK